MCGYSAKANKFALHIAHFVDFVLKICINLGKNSLICCKTLNKQRFLVFCLVVSKYVCTFAVPFRGSGEDNGNLQKTVICTCTHIEERQAVSSGGYIPRR